ncbi:MAG: carboxypeptidase-like regulatory domain-containing protein, partial [Terriglobia bacterium]
MRAQVDTGRISGLVSDQSGGVIPQTTVTLTNEGTGLKFVGNTGTTGYYMFPGLRPGTYRVEIEATGFARFLQLGIILDVQQDVVINAILKPGSVMQTVEVTAAPPALQTQSGSVGQVVGQQQINDLPLNGRNFTFLAQTVAGVHMSGFWSGGFGASGSFSANGTRPEQNNYLLDGMDNNTNQLDFLAGTNYVNLPPPDAMGEFKVQTADYSADLGKGGGAILNGTIKSGTNQLHGDVWEFVRNDKFDAAQFFENSGGIKKGEYRQNQFGGAVGGPVVIPGAYNGRNKTFFFADYQGTRVRQGWPYTNTVPTAAEVSSGFTNLSDIITGQTNSACLQNGTCTRTDALGRVFPNGTVFDPATTRPVTQGVVDPVTQLVATSTYYVRDPIGIPTATLMGLTDFTSPAIISQLNQLPATRLDPNAIKLLQLYPAAMGPGIVNNETDNPPLINTIDQSDIRMDHNFGDRDQMFGRVSFSINPRYQPPPFPGYADGGALAISGGGHQWNPTLNTVLSETHSFSPTIVN